MGSGEYPEETNFKGHLHEKSVISKINNSWDFIGFNDPAFVNRGQKDRPILS